MANILQPVISLDKEQSKSPVTEPPKCDFPEHEWKDTRASQGGSRNDSDTTLTEDIEETDHALHDERAIRDSDLSSHQRPHRPTITQKFGTEVTRPVGGRPILANLERASTGGVPLGASFAGYDRSDPHRRDESDESSSEDESEGNSESEPHGRFRQSPRHKDLSKSHLNRVRKTPRRDKVSISNEHFRGKGKVAKDGRLNISLNENANSGYLAKALGATIQSHLHPKARQAEKDAEEAKKRHAAKKDAIKIPRMNIVIMVIGSRGDIQPFLKIGRILKDKYGHRIRIATHPTFKKFVEEEIGLEFFSVGGDPSELMSFMVKNPGLIPSFETIKAGEVGRRREQMFEMFQGFWRACINATDDEKDTANLKLLGSKFPFVADAIIANPPSFAHFHCAEKLGIPLHLVFTFPFSPTSAFPHPLANIKATNIDQEYTNYMSYPLVELMTWQGLGDLVNRFRVKTLGLDPVSTLWAPGQATRLKIPMTYLWSPGLVPKPADWGPEIDIAGYVFLDLASSFKPPEALAKFLQKTDDKPIIYIGFGSISGIDDPKAFCELIFEAVVKAEVKAVVSRGWGGMGDGLDVPDDVYLIDNVPHDWLFPQMDAVVHHGGAGTTAAGLKCGKPTMIVPFFGDQPFWAAMVAKAGAGAKEALPLKKLDSEKFAQGIRECLEPDAKQQAQAIAKSIEAEGDGAENAVDSFHQALPLDGKGSMRCGIFDDRVAAWKVKHTGLQLSALAADMLVENKQLSWTDLILLRHMDWTDFQGPGEPITGVGNAILASFQEAVHGLTSISDMTKKDMRRLEKRKRRGRTVADVVSAPGRVAERARKHTNNDGSEAPVSRVNIHGEAEPLKIPRTTDGPDSLDAFRPIPLRTTTTNMEGEPLSAPVVIAKDVGRGVGHSAKAVVLLPLDVMSAITLGFRNAPRLYGDRTVRPPPKSIDGFRAGWWTAGKELWFGFYDGATGLVRIPHLDVQHHGFAGLPMGITRGFGGLLLKPIAGILGVPTYVSRGCVAWLRKQVRDTLKTERWLRRARMAEGAEDVKALSEQRSRVQTTPEGRPVKRRNDLEEVRTTVLSRWTTHERELVQEARAHERSRDVVGLLRPERAATA